MTRDEMLRELRARLEAAYADIVAAVDAGDERAVDAAKARARAAERALEGEGGLRDLAPAKHRVKLGADMVVAERLRVSGGRGRKNPLVVAANKAGYTQRSLAEKVGVSHSLLSRARDGHESISMEVAKRVELLTGFAATKAHWPKLRS